ncbi:Ankyrin-2 [Dactylella cylindrospora]|nr:Ankyrin-2 [Dactylella cylindrospora]
MAQDEQVPLYPEGGSLEEDLRRIAEASNNSATTQNGDSVAPPLPPPVAAPSGVADITAINSGDPDTDALIQRLLREDAEEAGTDLTGESGPVPAPNIVETFYECIKNSNSELISAFIEGGFVKVNTRSRTGETPLVAAVRANHVRIVQQLVDYGADVNEMSLENTAPIHYYHARYLTPDKYDYLQRTPLMVAAENGHLPLVKLFVEVFHARDDIVPIDGMTALRLAAQNGHREVVDFLPSRRIGGMQRWKYKNRKAIRRSKRILWDIYRYNKVVFYEVPKFFLWSIPKHIIVLPIRNLSVYLWKNKKKIAVGIKDFFVESAKLLAKGIKEGAIQTAKGITAIPGATVRGIKATGRGTVRAAKAIWKFTTVDLPKGTVLFAKGTARFAKKTAIWTKDVIIDIAKGLKKFTVWFAKQIWKTLTVRIPKALIATAKWLWEATKYCGEKAVDFVLRVASAIHTLVTKIVDWFSGITWKDVLNGFLDVFKFIFVEIPIALGKGVLEAGKFIKKLLETLFGFVGTCLWYMGVGIILLVTYVPQKIFELILELIGAIGRGLHEVAVWINPKTI